MGTIMTSLFLGGILYLAIYIVSLIWHRVLKRGSRRKN